MHQRITLHAEYLRNINSLSLAIQLHGPRTKETSLSLSEDSDRFHLWHEGENTTIQLPLKVELPGSANSLLPSEGACSSTYRLRPKAQQELPVVISDSILVPWSASSLTSDTEIRCACCCSIIVGRCRITQWKDLPSEGWAEMMDLWHCHKPHEDTKDEQQASSKGYAAGSGLFVKTGIGLVDALGFLLTKADCSGVYFHTVNGADRAFCSCNADVGEFDNKVESVKLYKPSLALSLTKDSQSQCLDKRMWLSCHLLSMIANTGIRKFYTKESSFEIWVFTPDLVYSSSLEGGSRTKAMKILYREARYFQQQEDRNRLNKEQLSIDELGLPDVLEAKLIEALEDSHRGMPAGLAMFQDWKVALLPTFSDEAM